MRIVRRILILALVATSLVGCFKDEKRGTLMRIALYSQNREGDPVVKTSGEVEAYAFWTKKGEEWEVTSWEDALAHRITNKQRPAETRNEADVIGSYDSEAEYQVSLELWGENAFLVLVDRTNKLYATRSYETPINLPEVMTHLHIYAHKKSASACGWAITNPFPDEIRESLSPDDEDDESGDDQGNESGDDEGNESGDENVAE